MFVRTAELTPLYVISHSTNFSLHFENNKRLFYGCNTSKVRASSLRWRSCFCKGNSLLLKNNWRLLLARCYRVRLPTLPPSPITVNLPGNRRRGGTWRCPASGPCDSVPGKPGAVLAGLWKCPRADGTNVAVLLSSRQTAECPQRSNFGE